MFVFCLLPIIALQAQTVAVKLRNGDKITGTVLSENTNHLVLATTWAKEIAIPLAEIQSRETIAAPVPVTAVTNEAVAAPATNTSPLAAPAPAPTPVVALAPPKPEVKPKAPSSWHGDVQLGADVGINDTKRQLYYGRAKIIFAPLPEPGPNATSKLIHRFRNTFDYNSAYGTTDGTLSANRMDGSSKTDFDLGQERRFFVYNLFGAGYDEIRKIDQRYEFGPGLGYHLITRSNLVLNTEIGMNYQVQRLQTGTRSERFYYRLAEDFSWKISKVLSFDEKFEILPQVNLTDFRFRFESNLRYWLLENLSLNLTLIDTYDTQLAPNVGRNDLQIRSSVGIKF